MSYPGGGHEEDATAARHVLQGFHELLAPNSRKIDKLQNEINRLHRQVAELQQRSSEAQAQILQRLDEHERRLTALSRAKTQDRLVSDAYLAHQEIRAEIDNLADQILTDIAARFVQADGEREEAAVIGRLARQLLQPGDQMPAADELARHMAEAGHPGVGPDDLRSACVAASGIRSRAAATGHAVTWDYDLAEGARLDSARQRPFSRCDAGAPAAFVVMPGYVVDGKVYVKQRVFTETAPAAPAGHATAAPAEPVSALINLSLNDTGVSAPAAPDLGLLAEALHKDHPQVQAEFKALSRRGAGSSRSLVVARGPGTEIRITQAPVEGGGAVLRMAGPVDEVAAFVTWLRGKNPDSTCQVAVESPDNRASDWAYVRDREELLALLAGKGPGPIPGS
ncbi:coiled-coil domain-containing protein [Actinacidiphila epipremni]|uniref:Uncharacterized protein n=1 Tax=Actinacidiphila epipremni TaxID=2053013 RepID=A0ABX0ZJJ3_9ACTN|nr:hypothetical protein [Actinacidiphila epipremni]NJP43277.1 hypothetical protein [Actinacidiphila epipremni]